MQIDRSWAVQILAGLTSPLAPLESRLGPAWPRLVENIRTIVGGRSIRRIHTSVSGQLTGVKDPLNAAGGKSLRQLTEEHFES